MVNLLKSRTIWTGVAMFALTYGPGLSGIVPDQFKPLMDGILTLLMFYFHVNPSASYGKSVLVK